MFLKKEKLKYLLIPIVIYGWIYCILLLLIVIMFIIVVIGGVKGERWKLNKKEINEYKRFLDEKDKKRN